MIWQEMIRLIRSGAEGREVVASEILNNTEIRRGVRKIVHKIEGPEVEMEEVFHYSIVQFMKSVMKNPEFTISSNVHSYIFGIARNICLQRIRKAKLPMAELPEYAEMDDDSVPIDLQIMNQERYSLLHSVLSTLGAKCREVLMHWAAGFKMAEIAKILDYSSDVVVRRKKMKCLQQLLGVVHGDNKLKSLLN